MGTLEQCPDMLLCPSDSGAPGASGRWNSYAFGMGDMVENLVNGVSGRQVRGIFASRPSDTQSHRMYRIRDVTDGTSNTVAMSERLNQLNTNYRGQNPVSIGAKEVEHKLGVHTRVSGLIDNPGLCYTVTDGIYFVNGSQIQSRFGIAWQDSQPMYNAFNNVLPPNAPACADGGSYGDSTHLVIPPASRHTGGANVLMADGSVRFIGDSIDTGDLSQRQRLTGPSKYGVWGNLGSKSGNEVVGEF